MPLVSHNQIIFIFNEFCFIFKSKLHGVMDFIQPTMARVGTDYECKPGRFFGSLYKCFARRPLLFYTTAEYMIAPRNG